MRGGHRRQVREERTQLDVADGTAAESFEQILEIGLQHREIDVGATFGAREHHDGLGEERRVASPERHQQHEHQLALTTRDLAHHAEVEEPEAVVGPAEVARMRVGMEEAISQHLLVVAREQLPCGLGPRRPGRSPARGDATNLVHHQHSACRELAIGLRCPEPRIRGEPLAEAHDARGLDREVELALKRLGEVLVHGLDIENPAECAAAGRLRNEHLE